MATVQEPRADQFVPGKILPDEHVQGYLSKLENLSVLDLDFVKLVEAEATQPSNPGGLLRKTQEYMRKLKSDFLELDNKVRFLDVILQSTDLGTVDVSDELLAETEISVAHAKNKLKKLKLHSTEEQKQLERAAAEVAQASDAFKAATASARGLLGNYESAILMQRARAAARELLDNDNSELIDQCCEHVGEMSADAVKAIATAYDKSNEAKDAEIASLEADIRAMTSETETSAAELSSLKETIKSLHDSVQDKEGQDERRIRLRELSNGHTKLNSSLSKLTGVKIIDHTPSEIVVMIAVEPTRSCQAHIELDNNRTTVANLTCKPAEVALDREDYVGRPVSEVIARVAAFLDRIPGVPQG